MLDRPIVTFAADGALYAVPVDFVQEILDLQPISPLPRVPHALLGVTNLRGGKCAGSGPSPPSGQGRGRGHTANPDPCDLD